MESEEGRKKSLEKGEKKKIRQEYRTKENREMGMGDKEVKEEIRGSM